MDGKTAVEIIKSKLPKTGSPEKIRLQKGGSIRIQIAEGGIEVEDFSSTKSFLPWHVFEETVNSLAINGGKAEPGDGLTSKLGGGDVRRMASIEAILIWAGICESTPGGLVLR